MRPVRQGWWSHSLPRMCNTEIARIARVPRQPVHNAYGCNHGIKARAAYTTSMAALWPTDDRPGFSALASPLERELGHPVCAEITIDPQSLRRTLRGRRVHCATRAAPSEPEHRIRRSNRWTALRLNVTCRRVNGLDVQRAGSSCSDWVAWTLNVRHVRCVIVLTDDPPHLLPCDTE